MAIFTSAVQGFALDTAKVTDSVMPLSFEKAPMKESETATTFVEVMNGMIDDYDNRRQLTMDMMHGKDVDVHELMISQAQVEMVSNLASTVATKVATAYQTLMNMQI